MNRAVLAVVFSMIFGSYSILYAESEIAKAEKAFLEGNYQKAIAEADRLIEEHCRQRDEVYYIKGMSELKTGRYGDARESFDKILTNYQRSKRSFDADMGIADSYFLESNTQRAALLYKDIIIRYPENNNLKLARSRLEACPKGSAIDRVRAEENAGPKALPSSADAPKMKEEREGNETTIQVGSFKNKRNAQELNRRLLAKGYCSYVEAPSKANDNLFRVKIGKLSSMKEAQSLASKLKRDGFENRICDDEICR